MSYAGFQLMHMDEFIDILLRDERVCDIILPRIQVRNKNIKPYIYGKTANATANNEKIIQYN